MAQQRIGRLQWGPLSFGPGSRYHVTAIEGLDDLPEIRAEDMERPAQHGDYTGPDYVGPRVIQLGLGLRADTPDQLRDLTLALRAATQPQRQPEPLLLLDQDTVVYGKVRRRSIPYDAEGLWRTGTAALEVYCADPYLYSLEEHSASTTAYSPAAGRTYPLIYAGATNLVLNPSTEIDASNQAVYDPATSGATLTRAATNGRFGTARTLVTPGSAPTSGAQYTVAAPITGGQTVTVSVWGRIPYAATIQVGLRDSTTGQTRLVTVPQLGTDTTWYPMSATITVPMGESYDRAVIASSAPGGSAWASDGMMVETGPVRHSYVDGSLPGCQWTGTPHASTSFRTLVGTDRTYGDAGQSGRLSAYNSGSSPAYPVLRLDGPVANPSIEQVNTGAGLTIDASLQAGEWLIIDTRTRAVLLNGESPRRSWVRAGAQWPLLQPGANTIAYRGSALPGSPGQPSLLTITWRDTSL